MIKHSMATNTSMPRLAGRILVSSDCSYRPVLSIFTATRSHRSLFSLDCFCCTVLSVVTTTRQCQPLYRGDCSILSHDPPIRPALLQRTLPKHGYFHNPFLSAHTVARFCQSLQHCNCSPVPYSHSGRLLDRLKSSRTPVTPYSQTLGINNCFINPVSHPIRLL